MNKTENKLVPELRFPEFKNDGEWEIKEVEDFFSVGSSKRVLQKDWTNKGIPFYRTRELVSLSKHEPFSSEIFVSENLFSHLSENYGIPTEGDFLVSGVGTLGICYQVKKNDKFYFKDGNVLWFKINEGIFSSYFKFCFQSDFIQNQILAQTSKSTVGTYTIQNAKKTKFLYPFSLNEQQKIADCLSSLDEAIISHNEKLEALKNHKKGLLQTLFPQEGETVPKYRFPEFKNDRRWKEEKLGNVCDVRDGTHDSPKYVQEGFPLITSKNLLNNGKMDFQNVSYITEDDYNQINKRSKVDIDDILFGMIGTIGNPVIVKRDDFAIKNVALIKTIGKLNQQFLLYQLKSNHILAQFERLYAGGILKFIALGIIRNLNIIIPSPKEQQKIADCLSEIDNLINAQTKKIGQLKDHKKGLMQRLFPQIA